MVVTATSVSPLNSILMHCKGWSIFDNFEWSSGVATRFGLQYLNYTDLMRTPKASMAQFLDWFK
jgi:beta-glucosidase/6-phospho-beta-glucosidase/beta-galactosidase